MITKKEKIKIERDFISLLLKNKNIVAEWIESGPDMKYFEKDHKYILSAIQSSFNNDVLLTRKTFIAFLNNFVSSKLETQAQESLFNSVNVRMVNKDDFPLFKTQIQESYISYVGVQSITQYQEDVNSKGALFATKSLMDTLNNTVTDVSEKSKIYYESVTDYADSYYLNLIERMKKGDEATIKCGIKEIDEAIGVGFAAGTLTLFCGDVGGFKSTMMLNVGRNIWKMAHKDVLYVPLEMPRDKMYQKFLAREIEIDFQKLETPTLLHDDEIEKVKNFKKVLEEHEKEFESRLFIMEAPEQIAVSTIRREIEKHIDLFKPKVVIIDYIANLIADKDSYRKDRNDLEIGNMLKALRTMGKPGALHKEGFAIVSGAQIGREALKRVRKSGDKTAFFSEDIRGSHEYSADADNIFFQMVDPQQPNQRLHVYRVKTRYGKPFANNSNKITLDVKPEMSLIKSIEDEFYQNNKEDILTKMNEADKLDFDTEDTIDEPDSLPDDDQSKDEFDKILGL